MSLQTVMWKVDPIHPAPEILAVAAEFIRAGKLVAIPTETVYGLAANALNEAAVRSIFEAKGRPSTNPVIVHVENEADVKRVALDFPEQAKKLARRFWPGPLSIVLPKCPSISDIVTAGGSTVAVRCPNHAVARALIRTAGVPLAAPSANLSMELSPTTADHVYHSLNGRIDAILDAGPCQVGIESTVVDLSEDRPRILRPGMITRTMIETLIGPVSEAKNDTILKSPGQMERHYCPKTPLRLFNAVDFVDDKLEATYSGEKVGIMGWNWSDPAKYASEMYGTLFQLDQQGLDWIQAWLPPDTPEWEGVRDRLIRAANRQM